MRLYVFGAEGQVARLLREAAERDGRIVIGYSGRAAADLSSAVSVEAELAKFSPDVLVNRAAYTAVDKAESEPLGIRGEPRWCGYGGCRGRPSRCPIIRRLNDYVFDGKKVSAYVKDDAVGP